MTDPSYTHIAVVLDRSGSMQSIKHDTEGGFEAFIKDQREQPGRATISLMQFDGIFDVVYPPKDIQEVPPLDLLPRGSTALLDAMGKGIALTGEFLRKLPENERPAHVLFVTITDGEENSSREWSREKVFATITEHEKKYDWTFAFLAANQDAIKSAASLGIRPATAMTYDASSVGSSYSSLSTSTSNLRSAPTGQSVAAFSLPDVAEDDDKKPSTPSSV